MVLGDLLGKIINEKIAIGTKRNRLRNIPNTPDMCMKPNMPFELGSAGVNTTQARVSK